mgnify:CR=1 FL=1
MHLYKSILSPHLDAVQHWHDEIVELFLSHRSRRETIDLYDYEGTTPIIAATKAACIFGNHALSSTSGSIFCSLLEAGCDLDIAQVSMGWTPMFVACFGGNIGKCL